MDQASFMVIRFETHILEIPPSRLDDMYNSRPSRDICGDPSENSLLTLSTLTGSPNTKSAFALSPPMKVTLTIPTTNQHTFVSSNLFMLHLPFCFSNIVIFNSLCDPRFATLTISERLRAIVFTVDTSIISQSFLLTHRYGLRERGVFLPGVSPLRQLLLCSPTHYVP